jgi:hypothetical protein
MCIRDRAGTDPLTATALKDREIFDLLGFD